MFKAAAIDLWPLGGSKLTTIICLKGAIGGDSGLPRASANIAFVHSEQCYFFRAV